jgi:hypothetical protein
MNLDCSEKLECFIRQSGTFAGFDFAGHYMMPPDNFVAIFKHYLETGENLLDAYSTVKYLLMDQRYDRGCVLIDEEYNKVVDILDNDFLMSFFTERQRLDCIAESSGQYINYLDATSYETRRVQANVYIADKNIRMAVFQRYGKKCLKCSREHNICLDHVIPVYLGGENSLDNLQPLCKPCNSEKGATTVDYRPKTTING